MATKEIQILIKNRFGNSIINPNLKIFIGKHVKGERTLNPIMNSEIDGKTELRSSYNYKVPGIVEGSHLVSV